MDFKNSMTGFEDFEAARRRLTRKKAKSAMSRAIGQGLTPVTQAAQQNVKARLDTGESYKAIKRTTSKSRINKLLSREGVPFDVRAEMADTNAEVGMVYLEEGTKGNRAFALRLWEAGFTRDGKHFAARPWWRPALDSTEEAFFKRLSERLKVIVEKEAAKR